MRSYHSKISKSLTIPKKETYNGNDNKNIENHHMVL